MARVGRFVKESMVQVLGDALAQHPNFFVTTMTRLQAPEADALRQKLHGSQARLLLVKRRLGRRTIEQLRLPGLSELLEGSVGFVFVGEDALPAAKLISEFRKAHEERLTVRGAVIDGQLLDAARVEQLAKLPAKPMLRAEVVFAIEGPIAQLIATVEQLVGDVAWLLEQAAATRPAAPEPAAAAPEEPKPALPAQATPEEPKPSAPTPPAPPAQPEPQGGT